MTRSEAARLSVPALALLWVMGACVVVTEEATAGGGRNGASSLSELVREGAWREVRSNLSRFHWRKTHPLVVVTVWAWLGPKDSRKLARLVGGDGASGLAVLDALSEGRGREVAPKIRRIRDARWRKTLWDVFAWYLGDYAPLEGEVRCVPAPSDGEAVWCATIHNARAEYRQTLALWERVDGEGRAMDAVVSDGLVTRSVAAAVALGLYARAQSIVRNARRRFGDSGTLRRMESWLRGLQGDTLGEARLLETLAASMPDATLELQRASAAIDRGAEEEARAIVRKLVREIRDVDTLARAGALSLLLQDTRTAAVAERRLQDRGRNLAEYPAVAAFLAWRASGKGEWWRARKLLDGVRGHGRAEEIVYDSALRSCPVEPFAKAGCLGCVMGSYLRQWPASAEILEEVAVLLRKMGDPSSANEAERLAGRLRRGRRQGKDVGGVEEQARKIAERLVPRWAKSPVDCIYFDNRMYGGGPGPVRAGGRAFRSGADGGSTEARH